MDDLFEAAEDPPGPVGRPPVVASATTFARLRPAFFRMSNVRTK